MRFVRSEYSLSVITDQVVEDLEQIRSVFTNLYKYNVEFSATIQKFFESTYEYKNFSYPKLRILKLHEEEDSLDLMYFSDHGNLIMKKVKFEDVIDVSAITVKNRILEEYIRVSRWDLLDFESPGEEV